MYRPNNVAMVISFASSKTLASVRGALKNLGVEHAVYTNKSALWKPDIGRLVQNAARLGFSVIFFVHDGKHSSDILSGHTILNVVEIKGPIYSVAGKARLLEVIKWSLEFGMSSASGSYSPCLEAWNQIYFMRTHKRRRLCGAFSYVI